MITNSIKIKLAALAELRGKSKTEVLNEALDRALSVHRADIKLKTAFLQLEFFRKDIEVQNFLRERKIA